jgi:hypothetical protein
VDIVAHLLWAGVGSAAAARHPAINRGTVVATVLMAGMPDLLQFLPLLAWIVFGHGSMAALAGYATALPGQAPALPPLVGLVSHHLHCAAHSAVVAAGASVFVVLATRSLWFPLLGWWSHIVIDVFTHSAAFYPAPVLYPFTYRGFDGIAWNEPWFMALNYLALLGCAAWLSRACAASSGKRQRLGTIPWRRTRRGP